jgi:N-acetylneuraminic acid mutarotase
MIVWGGLSAASNGEALATGGRLDGTWTPTSTAGAPEARWGHTAVWTGTEMIVFGGLGAWVNGAPALGTGGRYDPSTDTWRALPTGSNAPAPRYDAEAVWTGNEMLVWGGRDDSGAFLGDGARYDPVLDRWRPIAPGGPVRVGVLQAWSGSEWILHGGFEENTQVYSTDGFAYSPSTDEWRSTADVGAQFGEVSHPVWTGGEMIVWGRFLGRRYDPRTDRWKDVSMVDAPTGRIGQSVVWTGSSMIVFGGWDGVDLSTGAIYR